MKKELPIFGATLEGKMVEIGKLVRIGQKRACLIVTCFGGRTSVPAVFRNNNSFQGSLSDYDIVFSSPLNPPLQQNKRYRATFNSLRSIDACNYASEICFAGELKQQGILAHLRLSAYLDSRDPEGEKIMVGFTNRQWSEIERWLSHWFPNRHKNI